MASIEIQCKQCGSGEYQLLNPKTGEVFCPYCRNKWVVPALIQKTETERFLEEQAKQPRIIQDNSTETDQQLMKMFAGAMGFTRTIHKIARWIIMVVALVIIITTIVFFIFFFRQFTFF